MVAQPLPPLRVRWMLYVLVIAAVLIPLISGGQLDGLIRPLPGQAALAESLADLVPEKPVLVAVDYGPSAAAELDAALNGALVQLEGASVQAVFLSTRPEGVDLARQALSRLEEAGTPPGAYCHLGYLAGDAAGLRLALTSLSAALGRAPEAGAAQEACPALLHASGIGEMGAVLVITDDGHVARRWVEQVGARTDAPLLIITTAASEPLLAPYAASGQVRALVSGAYGGLSAASQDPRRTLYSADGFVALWAALAGGFAWGLFGRRDKTERLKR